MTRNTPKMVAIDLDGTLVHPGGTVTPGNQDALRRVREQGAQIVIATGRRHGFALQVLHSADFRAEDIVLSSNGAVARTVGGKTLFATSMPRNTALWLCDAVREFRGSLVLTFDTFDPATRTDRPGALVLEELDELHGSIEKWMTSNAAHIRRVLPIEDALPEGGPLPIQAMLCGSTARMRRAEELLQRTHAGRLSLTTTEYPARDLCILDILPPGCTKGSGLARLLQLANLAPTDLAAIGDNWNDAPMLELAAWPMLMGNAPEPLRAMAAERGWVVTRHHHEDGVAEALAMCFPLPAG